MLSKVIAKFLLFTLIISLPCISSAQNAKEPWTGAYNEEQFAGGEIRKAYCDLVGIVEGNFGGLLFAAAGIMALAFAAFGITHHTHTAVFTAVGAFTISAGVSLYFGDFGCAEQGGGGGNQTTRAVKSSSLNTSFEANSEEHSEYYYQDSESDNDLDLF